MCFWIFLVHPTVVSVLLSASAIDALSPVCGIFYITVVNKLYYLCIVLLFPVVDADGPASATVFPFVHPARGKPAGFSNSVKLRFLRPLMYCICF